MRGMRGTIYFEYGIACCLALHPVSALPVAAKPMIDDAHDRVQTTLDPMMDRIGTLAPRSAREIGPSHIAIGCEMLPRGYGDFESFKEYLPPLGIARVRLHAGWAKLEPEKGRWDFTWLDRQVNWLVENGMEPLLETSYGNSIYPGAGGASLSDGMPRGEEALAAWDRYVERLAARYPQVKNWACWNEPNNIDANTPEIVVDNNIRTARIILKHIPGARIGMLSLGTRNMNAFTEECLKLFRAKNAIGLFTWIIYHDYHPNPDDCYANRVDEWARIVRKYAPGLKIWNGESGATSDAHYSGGISSLKWNSELTQAKWDARRLVADLGHGFDSLVFTICDPCYDQPMRYTRHIPSYWVRTRSDRFMKRMGLLKCNDRLEVVKVKPAYYTVQNVATLFDSTIETADFCIDPFPGEGGEGLVAYSFRQKGTGIPIIAFWDASRHPENENAIRRATLSVTVARPKEPVWVDLVTGAIYRIPEGMVIGDHRGNRSTLFEGVPYYDAPVVITERALAAGAFTAYLSRNPPKDVLARADGTRVKSAGEWSRDVRPAVMKFFGEDVYGVLPPKPAKLDFRLVESGNAFGGAACRRQYVVRSEDANGAHDFDVLVYLPNGNTAPEKWRGPGRTPAFVYPNFSGNHTLCSDSAVREYGGWTYGGVACARGSRPDRACVEEIVRRGFAFATFCFNEVYPDCGTRDAAAESVWRIFDSAKLPEEKLAHPAWSWGAQRVRDLLETLPEIDQSKVAIVGHSRMGKNATITGAHDARFSLVCANCGGAKSLKHLPNLKFPNWFSRNLARYVQTGATGLPADELDRLSAKFPAPPFDQGEFLGCIAPRALVISTAAGDDVSCPESSYRTYCEANRIFGLFGKSVGWRIREGKHAITHDDWRWFMDYEEETLKW